MRTIIYTPFDGQKTSFDKLSEACRSLGLKEQTIRNHFSRTNGKPYVWEGGKLEKVLT